jgi:type I restriction enzyme S subunit
MELRAGYKKTEIGIFPADWKVTHLGKISIIKTGGKNNQDKEEDGRYPFFVRSDNIERINTFSYDCEAILIPGEGNIGRIFHYIVGKFDVHQRVYAITNFVESVSGKFVYFWMTMNFGAHAMQNSVKATVDSLRLPTFQYFDLALPPTLAEQRAIADALSDADALIASLDALIAKKRDLKQAAMQQLLTGKTRLPGFTGEWDLKRLGDVANIKTGKRNNQDKQEDGAYPFFVRSENVEKINSFSHDCEAILIPGEGNIGSIFHYIVGKFDVHQRVYAITNFIDGVSGKFVHLWMRMNFGAHAMQNTVKATVDSLRLPTFQDFDLMLPPTLAEQTAIAEALSDMDAELAELEVKRDKACDLKQGMMQELLTGRIRLV